MKFKIITFIILSLLLSAAGFLYYRYYFVFGTGIKSGELNQIVKKGYIFKTYEGRLIQAGFKGTQQNTIQSYEFNFSVEDEEIAKKLERLGGKNLELHYNEYMNVLPWRGNSVYIVDSIVAIKDEEYSSQPAKKAKQQETAESNGNAEEEEYDEVFKSLEYYNNER